MLVGQTHLIYLNIERLHLNLMQDSSGMSDFLRQFISGGKQMKMRSANPDTDAGDS